MGGAIHRQDHARHRPLSTFLRDRYLAKASPAAGLSGTLTGPAAAASRQRATTLDLPPEQIGQIGWRLLRNRRLSSPSFIM